MYRKLVILKICFSLPCLFAPWKQRKILPEKDIVPDEISDSSSMVNIFRFKNAPTEEEQHLNAFITCHDQAENYPETLLILSIQGIDDVLNKQEIISASTKERLEKRKTGLLKILHQHNVRQAALNSYARANITEDITFANSEQTNAISEAITPSVKKLTRTVRFLKDTQLTREKALCKHKIEELEFELERTPNDAVTRRAMFNIAMQQLQYELEERECMKQISEQIETDEMQMKDQLKNANFSTEAVGKIKAKIKTLEIEFETKNTNAKELRQKADFIEKKALELDALVELEPEIEDSFIEARKRKEQREALRKEKEQKALNSCMPCTVS
ncbi:MAG: hypothetical protein WCJ92_08355 [Alphaproteobacteria bacterium]